MKFGKTEEGGQSLCFLMGYEGNKGNIIKFSYPFSKTHNKPYGKLRKYLTIKTKMYMSLQEIHYGK